MSSSLFASTPSDWLFAGPVSDENSNSGVLADAPVTLLGEGYISGEEDRLELDVTRPSRTPEYAYLSYSKGPSERALLS